MPTWLHLLVQVLTDPTALSPVKLFLVRAIIHVEMRAWSNRLETNSQSQSPASNSTALTQTAGGSHNNPPAAAAGPSSSTETDVLDSMLSATAPFSASLRACVSNSWRAWSQQQQQQQQQCLRKQMSLLRRRLGVAATAAVPGAELPLLLLEMGPAAAQSGHLPLCAEGLCVCGDDVARLLSTLVGIH